MSYMRSTDSAILQEFGRIMQEKDELKKVAQVVNQSPGQSEVPYLAPSAPSGFKANPPAAQAPAANSALAVYTKKLNDLKARAEAPNPNHDPRLLISRQEYAQLAELGKAVSPEVAAQANGPLLEYDAGRNPKSVLLGLKTHEQMAAVPTPSKTAVLSVRQKKAEQRFYDVTGKEDIVHEAHPQTAKVEGDVVENLNEQQDADLIVAEKSAKNVLIALYKLAKRLRAEKNMKAYSLVKETFLQLSKSLKK